MVVTRATETPSELWPAPAKLNLFLRVTGKSSSGYHDLQTLFQILNWGDELSISINHSGNITRSCNLKDLSEAEDISVKAARMLKSCCDIRMGADIVLNKRIPMGAGLGGGSSDAATVLVALNSLWSCGLTSPQLAELGLQLGADVPVFVHGCSAWAEGRGEKLQAVSLGSRHYVLVFPGLHVSTAGVFNHAALKRDSKPLEIQLSRLAPGRNDCEIPVFAMYPELKRIKQEASHWGQVYMTGTGSTLFLPFDSEKSAIKAAGELKCRYNVRAVEGVDRSPLLDRLSFEG